MEQHFSVVMRHINKASAFTLKNLGRLASEINVIASDKKATQTRKPPSGKSGCEHMSHMLHLCRIFPTRIPLLKNPSPSGGAQAFSSCFYFPFAVHQKSDFIFTLNLSYIQAACCV